MLSSAELLLCVGTVIFFIVVSHTISLIPNLKWIPESALIILFGLIVTAMLGTASATFDTELFFKILLSPIIFASGFKVDLKVFYQNISTIMVFANFGTIVNALIFAVMIYGVGKWNMSTDLTLSESLSFGSVISATDPVTTIAIFDHLCVEPTLYVIVVGVSILDDAVSIIMFNMFNEIIMDGQTEHSTSYYISSCISQFLGIFFGSVLLGYAIGIAVSAAMKSCKEIVGNPVQFHMLMLCAIYFCYFAADAMKLSGIIAVMFAGIAMQRYCNYFLSAESLLNVTHSVSLVAQTFETIVFFMIGFSLLQNTSSNGSDILFGFWSLLFCLISRAVQIYPLALILNAYNEPLPLPTSSNSNSSINSTAVAKTRSKEYQPLTMGYQHIIFVAGLRGPISYAMSKLFPDTYGHANLIAVTTSVIVVMTIVCLGPLTIPMLKVCKIRYGDSVSSSCSRDSSGNQQCEDENVESKSNGNIELRCISRSIEDGIADEQLQQDGRLPASEVSVSTSDSTSQQRAWRYIHDCIHFTPFVKWLERVEYEYIADYFISPSQSYGHGCHSKDCHSRWVCCTCWKRSLCLGSTTSSKYGLLPHEQGANNGKDSEHSDERVENPMSPDASQSEFTTGSVIHGFSNKIAAIQCNSVQSKSTISEPKVASMHANKSSGKDGMVNNNKSDNLNRDKAEFERMLTIIQDGVDLSVSTFDV